MSGKVKVWGNVVTVEWADPVEEPDPEVMAKVKVLFVRNLATTVTEEILEKSFSEFGKLERVKKLKDYAFVHFEDRGAAIKAMDEMNGKEIEGEEIEIVLAKPPDKERKEHQAARQASRSTAYEDYYYHPPPCMPPPIRGRGRGGGGADMATLQITMAMKTIMMITMVMIITTSVEAMKIPTTAMMMAMQ